MKNVFVLFSLLLFSTYSFSDAFIGLGYTTQFESLSSDLVDDKHDRMILLNLDGVNINSTLGTKHKGKPGFSFTLGFGKNAYSSKKTNYSDNTMFGVGFNFPVTDFVYFKAGGNVYSSKTKLSNESINLGYKNKDLTKYGVQFAIGTVINNTVLASIGYNSSINASTLNIGYRFR